MIERTYHKWLVIALSGFIVLQSARIMDTGDSSGLVSRFADDAFFYLKIADNGVDAGKLSFDGISATNGFHPLWMGSVLLLRSGFHDSHLFLISVSLLSLLLMGWCGLIFLRNNEKAGNAIPVLLVFILLLRYIRDFAMMSMETSLVLPLAFLLLHHLKNTGSRSGNRKHLVTGFLIAAMVMARLDSALLGIVAVIFLRRSYGFNKLLPVILPGILCLIGYMAVNYFISGSLTSVSSMMKASGFGFNNLFADQLFLLRDPLGARSPWGLYLVFLIASFFVLFIRKMPETAKTASLFLILFSGSQLFLSQWRLWYWYAYPAVIFLVFGLTPLLQLVYERLKPSVRLERTLIIVMTASVVLLCIYWGLVYGGVEVDDFRYRNMLIARELNDILPDSTVVATGDRAGSFAWFFHGHVIQGEGLAGDVPFAEAVQNGRLEEQLRFMGADYILSWTGPHGVEDYECWDLVIPDRAQCTVFNNTIRVYRENEIIRWSFENQSVFLWSLHEN